MIIKKTRGLISLSFQCGVKRVNTVEVSQNAIFTCTKFHIKGSLEKIGREYGLQPELLKGELEPSVINKNDIANLKQTWQPYLKLDVLCLAFIYARNSMDLQAMSGYSIKDLLTEANLGWKCFGKYNKTGRELCKFKEKYVRDFIHKSIKRRRVSALSRFYESKQCDEMLNTMKST